jgi:hypothetical protein
MFLAMIYVGGFIGALAGGPPSGGKTLNISRAVVWPLVITSIAVRSAYAAHFPQSDHAIEP